MKEYIEKALANRLEQFNTNTTLFEAMKYAVLNGGKRIRPMFSLHIADIFKVPYEKIIDISVAIEFIHCYSLVHDDLPGMDNDMYRRGKLTTHAKYGHSMGILVGDALLTESFSVIAKSNLKYKAKIIERLCYYAGVNGMIKGQELDIQYENTDISLETLKEIHKNKTAALLVASVELVLIELEIDYNTSQELINMMYDLGVAYQIQDDILDVYGDFKDTGKNSSDIENNKSTYVSLLGIEKAKNILSDTFYRVKKVSSKYEKLDNFIESIIKRRG